MSLRSLATTLVIAVAILALGAWIRNTQHPSPAPIPQATGEATPGADSGSEPGPSAKGAAPTTPDAGEAGQASPPVVESGADPGMTWAVPARWKDLGPGSARLATYTIPAAPGSDAAQCAVYYFGPGQGGTVVANLERWSGEFTKTRSKKSKTFVVQGLAVSRIALSGAYLAHAGVMGSGQEIEEPDWSLLGAIVEGPSGLVFFKLTGPSPTARAGEAEFDSMIGSLRKK